MAKQRSAFWVVASRLLGLLLFLLVVFLANLLVPVINIFIFKQIVYFINDNLALLVAMSILFLVADALRVLFFPLSLAYPIFSAVASVLLVKFIFNCLLLVDSLLNKKIFYFLTKFDFIIYPLVFAVTLIAGYVSIFFSLFKKSKF